MKIYPPSYHSGREYFPISVLLRTVIGKYSFVNRTIRFWNRLSTEVLGTLSSKPNAFRKGFREEINVVI